MSQAALPVETQESHRGRPNHDDHPDDGQGVIEALADRGAREILAATSAEQLTVEEISDALDLPQSTAYRKVDRLVEAGLLREQIRIRRSGTNVSAYACDIDKVTISLGSDPELALHDNQEDSEH